MFCEHCGIKVKEGAQFCQSCGKSTLEKTSYINQTEEYSESTVRCNVCKYTGPGELSRKTLSQVLAWLCIFIAPIITLGYYASTYKYQCPNCESTALHIKNEEGVFLNQKRTKTITKVFLWIFVGTVVMIIMFALIPLIN